MTSVQLDNFSDVDISKGADGKTEARLFVGVEVGEFTCAGCQKKSKSPMKECLQCHKAHYCSTNCQVDDWDKHKLICS